MRSLLAGLVVLFLIASASAVTVTVSSPSSGSAVSTSFTVNASATSSNTVTGWWIYVDGNGAWNTPGPTSSISATLTVSAGTHTVVVKAWDSTGASGYQSLSVSASTSTSTSTSSSTTSSGTSVTVLSPLNGAAVTSPVTFQATGTSPNGISGWVIYIDGNNAYQVDNYSNSLTASVSVASGWHSVYIRAWDKISGYGTSSTFSINVSSSTATTVAVQSPISGASVSDPVAFQATGSSANGISGWVIYMDGQNVYQVDNNSNTLTASVTLPTGSHSIYIRAWDKYNGTYGTSPNFTINVGASTGLPTPPSTATVFKQIEDMTTGWHSCSNCAGGASTTSNYWMAQFQGSPSMDGSSTEFYNGGTAWSNVLWYKPLGAQNFAANFLWDFYVYFDSTTIANLWTAEFDLYQAINGFEWMIGSQCNFGDGDWNTWNQAAGTWVSTSVPCPRWSANTWHHIQWYMQRVSSTQYKYVTLVVDGVSYPVNQTYSGSYSGWADTLGVQWQLDLNSTGTRAYEWIDNVTLTIW